MRVFSLITLCTLTACESLFGSFISTKNCDPQTMQCQISPDDGGYIDLVDMSGMQSTDMASIDLSMEAPPDMTTPIPAGMLLVAGKSFTMGRTKVSSGSDFPSYTITVNKFLLDINEVKTKDYKDCITSTKCTPIIATLSAIGTCNLNIASAKDNDSVNCVTHAQADAYCKAIGKRLPTEAEWELAATGGMQPTTGMDIYPWGETLPALSTVAMRLCWNKPNNGTCGPNYPALPTKPYITFAGAEAAVGFVDLAGSLREWTGTNQCSYMTKCATPTSLTSWVVRGSSFQESITDQNTDNFLRATYRGFSPDTGPDAATDNRGFRCAKDYPQN